MVKLFIMDGNKDIVIHFEPKTEAVAFRCGDTSFNIPISDFAIIDVAIRESLSFARAQSTTSSISKMTEALKEAIKPPKDDDDEPWKRPSQN